MTRVRSLPLALDRHRAALADCRACTFTRRVRPIVSEARTPKVLLVGQAPGQTECDAGRPFSGRAGKTLFQWLARAGVDEATFREQVYMSAITRCYPGPSPSGRGDRVPSPAERANCGQWLDAELSIIRPKLIIPVGRLAIDRFLGPLPLDQVIGTATEVAYEGGQATVVPLPHPSGASSWIHGYGHKTLLEEALNHLRIALRNTLYFPA